MSGAVHEPRSVLAPSRTPAAGQAPQIEIGRTDDPAEHEAERIAAQVLRTPGPGVVSRCACGGEAGAGGECTDCRARRLELRRNAVAPAAGPAPPVVHKVLASPGRPLDGASRAFFEPRLGVDLSGVRVHDDALGAESARAVGARAWAVGNHVAFAAGHESRGPSAVLAHELAHVAQRHHGLRRQMPATVLRTRIQSGSYSPGHGITISWNGNAVSITARLQISGSAASAAVAAAFKSTIERVWNRSFPDGYSVTCSVDVAYRGPNDSADSSATQIEVVPGGANSTSYVQRSWLVGARYMYFYLSGTVGGINNLDWVPAHEFGHLLGLDDRYSEGLLSRINARLGRQRTTTVEPGWEGNLMALDHGVLESKNIADLLELYAYRVTPLRVAEAETETPETAAA